MPSITVNAITKIYENKMENRQKKEKKKALEHNYLLNNTL